MLALLVAAVVEAPQLGALVLGVPLAELVAEAEHALLGPRLLLVAAGAAEDGVEALLLDAAQQRDGLEAVAAGPGAGVLDDPAGVDVVLDARDDETSPDGGDHVVAEGEHLGEVVAGVDVHDRERHPRRGERLDGEVQHHDRVLAAREQQRRPLELGGDLTDDVDRLGLQRSQVGELVGRGHERIRVNLDPAGKQSSCPASPPPPTMRWRSGRPTEAGRLLLRLRADLMESGPPPDVHRGRRRPARPRPADGAAPPGGTARRRHPVRGGA